jgi:uncharacterized protein YegP (UPF0339 family)
MAGEDDKWEFYKDKRGEHRWRRRASNGNIVGAATEGYTGRSSCTANAERHGYNGNSKGLGGDDNWEFYKDNSGEHRWRRRARNKEITGASSESYKSSGDCKANARRNGYPG